MCRTCKHLILDSNLALIPGFEKPGYVAHAVACKDQIRVSDHSLCYTDRYQVI